MTTTKVLALLFGLLFITSPIYARSDEYTCSHDSQVFEAEPVDIEEDMSALSEGRNLADSSYPNMRMKAYFGVLKQNSPANFAAYVQNELVPPVLSFLSAALRVKYPVSGALKISSSMTCDVSTPSELKAGVNADYYVIFDSYEDDTSVVASSRFCQTASGTNRPLTAYSTFNRGMFDIANGDVLIHEKNMYLVIHELMHTLAISKNSFDYFLDANGKQRKGHVKDVQIGGYTQTVIDIPELTARLQSFYGCTSVPGLILENDGGSGTASSHLERKYFVYETMSSGGILSRRVSQFSLGLLEGSGWYVPDYSYAEPFFYGEGQGCSFLNSQCSGSKPKFDEFCTGSSRTCASQGRAGGTCWQDPKANGCGYIDPEENYDCENADGVDYARFPDLETYGRSQNSKCFTGTLNARQSSNGGTSFCFKYNCVGSGSDTKLEVQVGKNKITCTAKGSKSINGYYGVIDCPDPLTFCNTVGKKYCPRNCMGRGKCVNNKCVCDSGFSGTDCGLYI